MIDDDKKVDSEEAEAEGDSDDDTPAESTDETEETA